MAGPAAQLDEAKRFAEIVAILQKHHLVQGLTPEKVRDIFVDLGPTFVKFGQILSMRSDILPKEYCAALETLRTDVTPMPLTEVERILTQAYARPWQEVFSDIGIRPLGSASIAQVHEPRRAPAQARRRAAQVHAACERAGLSRRTRRDLAHRAGGARLHDRGGQHRRIQASQRRHRLCRLPGDLPDVVHEERARHGVCRRSPDRRRRRSARRRLRPQRDRRQARAQLYPPDHGLPLLPRRSAPRQHPRAGREDRLARPRHDGAHQPARGRAVHGHHPHDL